METVLKIININKTYEGQSLLRGVHFEVNSGETVCLLGSSGSGKSTLLRIIAGLETAEHGSILWQGQDIRDLDVHLRNFSLMFQDYALFPHLNVQENVAFGLRMRALLPEVIDKRVHEVLELVNMRKFALRRVTDLSGGEQQRVALARALAPQPRLLMLDEPLGALDKSLKEQLSNELRTLLHHLGIPAIYVTHDQQEAFTVADRLVVLHEGRVTQTGIAEEIVAHPSSLWLAQFLGFTNQLEGEIISMAPCKIQTPYGLFINHPSENQFHVGQRVTIVLKPYETRIIQKENGVNSIRGKVGECIFHGDEYSIQLLIDGQKIINFINHQELKKGSLIRLEFKPEMVLCYAK